MASSNGARVFSTVRGPLAASSVSIEVCAADRRSFSIFSKAETSGLAVQTVGWEIETFCAVTKMARKNGNKTIRVALPVRIIETSLEKRPTYAHLGLAAGVIVLDCEMRCQARTQANRFT